MNIPYNFNGTVEYKKYNVIEDMIKTFKNYSEIGEDESGIHTMYKIEIGDPNNPPILITAGVHGNEWQAVDYSLQAMKMLDNDTYPDKSLMTRLKNHFYIVYLPCLNPWGLNVLTDIYGQFTPESYNNSKGVDINRDFVSLTQQETKNVVNVMKEVKPFAHVDCHLFQPDYGLAQGNDLIVGIENSNLYKIRDEMANSISNYINKPVTKWDKMPSTGKVRDYTGNMSNDYTPHTIALLTEIERPAIVNGEMVRNLTDEEIYKVGNAYIWTFLKLSLQYFDDNMIVHDDNITIIKEPTKETTITRLNGKTLISENKNGRIIETTFDRNSNGDILKVYRSVKK